ncbi:hypothetical protein M407DRAFT_35070 [Tulasnella calospora MUT 4182]|uniref:Uncharacterized protein n=1 Tax=Tulasnella calospora MUT 4182 TaxID=1051891 RepID=A0A0C3Q0D9_9AGAM|nr:hypothetical protein M407DRAFT_35070 [Tulasnella calospora MUT 4182]
MSVVFSPDIYGSRRLFWLPDHYRDGSEFVLFPSVKRLAFATGSTLVLLDVSSLLKF